MNRIRVAATIVPVVLAAAAATPSVSACDAIVDFSSQPVGATWGGPAGTPPGVTQFTEAGIGVGFLPIHWGGYDIARVDAARPGSSSPKPLRLSNIAANFDLGGLPCVASVSFDFSDLGGVENLAVNGASLYVGDLSAIPAAIAPGVTASVITAAIPGGVTGRVTLTGDVRKLLVAGQEFWMDDLCVSFCPDVPPPSDCDQRMHFESRPIGESWGSGFGTPPGAVQFVENGLPARFVPTTWGAFVMARVDPQFPYFPDSHILNLNNIALAVDTTTLGCAERVSFRFLDLGGTEELGVNGAPRYVGDLAAAPVAIAPGVTCTVTTSPIPGGGGVTGTVVLTGHIDRVVIAGQEFWLDDLCVELSDCVADVDCDGMVGFSDLVKLLAAWGPCGGPICRENLDGDSDVDFDDLLVLLSAWGAC